MSVMSSVIVLDNDDADAEDDEDAEDDAEAEGLDGFDSSAEASGVIARHMETSTQIRPRNSRIAALQ